MQNADPFPPITQVSISSYIQPLPLNTATVDHSSRLVKIKRNLLRKDSNDFILSQIWAEYQDNVYDIANRYSYIPVQE